MCVCVKQLVVSFVKHKQIQVKRALPQFGHFSKVSIFEHIAPECWQRGGHARAVQIECSSVRNFY